MEKELNIAAILKDKPQNTRLWSPIFGDVYLKDVTDVNNNMIRITHHGVDNIFMNNGKVWADGDVCLFPSRRMDDWQKFAWKKGDVLICVFSNLCIFDKWCNEEYTEFDAKFVSPDYGGAVLKTHNWSKVLNESTKKRHIAKIEGINGGKLNLETLEIEHPKQEFKDGDILYMNGCHLIYIFKKKVQKSAATLYYASLDADYNSLYYNNAMEDVHGSRLATEEEKQQLFDALASEEINAINEAHIYRDYESIPHLQLAGNPPCGKERRRARRMLELRKRKGRL